MKQMSEQEDKPLTSSLNICQKRALEGGGLSIPPSPSPPPYFPAYPLDISFKDDVTVILLLGVFFMKTQVFVNV
jgi:hypothetical protein